MPVFPVKTPCTLPVPKLSQLWSSEIDALETEEKVAALTKVESCSYVTGSAPTMLSVIWNKV